MRMDRESIRAAAVEEQRRWLKHLVKEFGPKSPEAERAAITLCSYTGVDPKGKALWKTESEAGIVYEWQRLLLETVEEGKQLTNSVEAYGSDAYKKLSGVSK